MADPPDDDLMPPDDDSSPKDSTAADELSDDDLDALDPDDEIGGDAASHPNFVFPSVLVGPATEDQFNTIEEWIRPVACWRLDDTRFEFDSSFVKPGAAREFKMLVDVRADHPGATLSLFGHADPVGDEDYNKALSGRRARAVYAMLTRNSDTWEALYKKDFKCSGDIWGKESLATMLTTVGRSPDEAGSLDSDGRKALYLQYMDRLCGPRLKLGPSDFLGRGADADLRGDVQGCSEFNAVLRFSSSENAELSRPSNKGKRDTENAPNRRVVGFLFAKELVVDPKRWPCPASTKGPEKCRPRFFVNHVKRRANTAERRTFADNKNTFECRFYHRLAIQSPCETSMLTSLQRIRVRLRLQYLDPMGKPHPFPKGYRVSALSPDGSARNARVGDDGKVRFVIDRPKQSFSLEFNTSDSLYFASAGPDSSAKPADKLVAEENLDDAIKQGYRVFKVPHQWSTRNSDWTKVDSPLYADGSFSGIDALDAVIGTIEAPVNMLLDPHWQYLRWVYFDRILLKQLPVPPIMVEGFEVADLSAGEPDTRSNWTTDGNKNQALPWIRRDDPNRPDENVLLQLNTGMDRTFIETQSGGTRKIVTVDDSGAADTVKTSVVDTPSVQRMNYYDLPRLWKSRGYYTRFGNSGDAFEKIGGNKTSDGQPFIFSLDDVVLTDENFAPIAWNPTNDRVAIFSNKLHKGVKDGLFRPDGALPYLSQVPSLVKDRNYLADYPDWTRLICMRGSLYDVFDRRVADSGSGVVGARAAVCWAAGSLGGGAGANRVNVGLAPAANRTVTAVQISFFQDHLGGEGRIGRMDLASLRCCDIDKGTEIGVNLHYLRLNFNFKPTPPKNDPARVPNSVNDTQGFVNDGAKNVATRWNGPDGEYNAGNVTLVPAKGAPLRMPVIWFVQSYPHPLTAGFNAPEAQYTIEVWKDVRAFMDSSDGTGQIKENENNPVPDGDFEGRFTLAHECGHGDSLADEYIESSNDCSYKQPGYRDYLLGGPYNLDHGGMMRGNYYPRGRHYWHAAEWQRSLDGTEFAVQYDGLRYSLPPHKDAPLTTYVTTPVVQAPNVRSGTGFYDCWLYRFGQDKFSVKILKHGPFDGFISVNVRMKCTFLDNKGKQITDHDTLKDSVSKIFSAVQDRISGKFFATGSANGMNFTKAYLNFFPRFLVVNDSGDANYHKGLDNPNNLPYAQLVTSIETNMGPTHCNVTFTQKGPTQFVANAGGANTLTFNMDDLDLTDDFPQWFSGLIGINNAKDTLKQPGNYVAIVQQVMKDGKVFALPG